MIADTTSIALTTLSYQEWLSHWASHMIGAPSTVHIPLEATSITTPLIAHNWLTLLKEYPNQHLVTFFITGITDGFRIGFNSPPGPIVSAEKNLLGAIQHPGVVDQYLAEELSHHRIAGPFHPDLIPEAHISRFGVIPKNHQPNKWRLIVDLSHPSGRSINDGIPKDLCSLTYITVDKAVEHIRALGKGTLLAKIDIKSAFRLLPVHPADRHLLAMKWHGRLYVDTCLPFGLRSAPKLFNILADLLSWLLEQMGVSPVLHYLDDFLTMGAPDAPSCLHNLQVIKGVCQHLGIPLAVEKVEGPSNSLTFLGIVLDTVKMEARLPLDKLQRIRLQVSSWLDKKKAKKRQILSLVGLLQHATKVVKPGRTFVARMYRAAARLRKLHHVTRLSKEFKSDLKWWHMFITYWNGVSFLTEFSSSPPPCFDNCIQTDASGHWGCGARFSSQWLQHSWSALWADISIMAKELVPIIFSCAIWGPLLARTHTEFQCDNLSLVEAIQKGSSKDNMVMHLLRCLWFFQALFDISIHVSHIPGVQNTAADLLSRNQTTKFLQLYPQSSLVPTPVPAPLQKIVSPQKLDWTSAEFLCCFRQCIDTVLCTP